MKEMQMNCYGICPKCGEALFGDTIHSCPKEKQLILPQFFDKDGKILKQEPKKKEFKRSFFDTEGRVK